jgi:hypothetical protein
MDLADRTNHASPSIQGPRVRKWELPPEIERLRDASASGELADAKAVFSQLVPTPIPEEFDMGPYVVALSAAVRNNHVHIASYLLSQGVPLNVELFVNATERKSYEMLQTFLDHGWNINEPIGRATPAPLRQVTLRLTGKPV